jgi:hypothetical protein
MFMIVFMFMMWIHCWHKGPHICCHCQYNEWETLANDSKQVTWCIPAVRRLAFCDLHIPSEHSHAWGGLPRCSSLNSNPMKSMEQQFIRQCVSRSVKRTLVCRLQHNLAHVKRKAKLSLGLVKQYS